MNPFCISIFVIAAENQPAVASEDSNQDVFVLLLLASGGSSIAYIFPSIFKSGHVEGVKQGGSVNPFRKQGGIESS